MGDEKDDPAPRLEIQEVFDVIRSAVVAIGHQPSSGMARADDETSEP